MYQDLYARSARYSDDDHIFFCGMAIGYRDPEVAVNNFPVPRAPLDDVVNWLGF